MTPIKCIKNSLLTLLLAAQILTGGADLCFAQAVVGSEAPPFSAIDSEGVERSLASLRGKIVVLEWFNPNCPFIKKFYANGDMQRFQEEAIKKGAAWLTIASAAPGKNGHITKEGAPTARSDLAMKSTALLLDSGGSIGKAYGARTTPHLFVIDAQGKVAYTGAIDSAPSTDSDDIKGATNYVLLAVDALSAGKPVLPSSTDPYGCSIKY